jgi:hypothetical protein
VFLGMWAGTREYRAERDVAPNAALTPADIAGLAAETAIAIGYDQVRGRQVLVYRGVLVDSEYTRITTAHAQPLLGQLLDDVRQQAKGYFQAHLEKSVVGTQPVGFLASGDFATLFTPPAPGSTDAQLQQRDRTRRATLAGAFLPFLQDRLIRDLVIQTLSTGLPAEPAVASALATEAGLLADRAHPGEPLLAAFSAADARGLTVTTAVGSLRADGYLEVPEAGAYRFFVRCAHQNTAVELRFDHLADPLVRGTASADGAELDGYTELRPGVAYGMSIEASDTVTVFVQGENLAKGPLDRLTVYPQATVERIRRAYVLLGKAARLVAALTVSEPELRLLLTNRADFGDLDLGWLPTGSTDDDPSRAASLFGQLLRVVDYARLRDELDAPPDDLVAVLAHARRSYPATADPTTAGNEVLADLYARFGQLTRREPAAVQAAATKLGMTAAATPVGGALDVAAAGFADERGLRRLWEV